MKTEIKKVTIEDFSNATVEANAVIRDKNPKTKLAHWCSRFLELNKGASKVLEKENKKRTKKLISDYEDVRIDLSTEKDGKVHYNEKGELQFSKENLKKLNEKKRDLDEALDEVAEKMMQEEIDVRVFLDPIEPLPDDIQPETLHFLRDFVIVNKPEFHEEIE